MLHALLTMLVLAVLANGMYFWLQKSQLIPSSTYLEYRQAVQSAKDDPTLEQPKLELEGFYAVPKPWIFTKLLKDFFILAFGLSSILLLRQSRPIISKALLIPALLAASLVIAFIQSLYLYGAWVAIAGLRPVAYLCAGLAGVWAMKQRNMELICHYLVAVLIIELVLALYEYVYGIPLFSTARTSNRVNGTLSFPSSMGVFAITVCVFAFSFSKINRLLLLVLALSFVYLTGSATALVLLAVALSMWAAQSVPDTWKVAVRITSLGMVTVMLLSLPTLVARHDVFDSLWGRIEPATDYIRHSPTKAQILLGKGLGVGSNVVNSAVTHSESVTEPTGVNLFHARADSTPLALINQIGILGTLLFYLVLTLAAWRDRQALPVYLIIILAGMTINVIELFPVNFLLGLLLCRSLLMCPDVRSYKAG